MMVIFMERSAPKNMRKIDMELSQGIRPLECLSKRLKHCKQALQDERDLTDQARANTSRLEERLRMQDQEIDRLKSNMSYNNARLLKLAQALEAEFPSPVTPQRPNHRIQYAGHRS